MKKLKKKIFHKAYSMIEMSLLILIIGILFAGAYQGFNIYNETKLSSVRTLMQNSIISRIRNLGFWFETASENSLENSEAYDGKAISVWIDHNAQQTTKINAYGAQNSNKEKFNYDPNNIFDRSGPIYVANGIGGLPTLNFKNTNSSAKFLVIDPSFKFSKEDITIFTVLRFKNFENNAVIFDRICLKSSGAVTYDDSLAVNECKPLISARVSILGYPNLFIQSNDGSPAKSTANTSFQIKKDVSYILTFERIFNQSIGLYQNGKLVASTPENLGEINFSPIKIGRGGTDPDQNVNSDFDLSEFIMVYGKLKNEHKLDIENYLAKKYSIKLER
jgi:Tfp pilus assembly protein PilE